VLSSDYTAAGASVSKPDPSNASPADFIEVLVWNLMMDSFG
jgi:hypothetical protein